MLFRSGLTGYAGTFDMLAIINGEYCLIDWKTSYKEKPEEQLSDYRQQLGGYSQAIELMYDIEINRAICAISVYDPEDPESEPKLQLVDIDGNEILAMANIVNQRCRRYFSEKYPGGRPFSLTMDRG